MEIRQKKMFVFGILVNLLLMLRATSVVSTCIDDANKLPVIGINENTLAGSLILKVTDGNDLALAESSTFLEVINGSIYTSRNLTLDGVQNKDLCRAIEGSDIVNFKCQGSSNLITKAIDFHFTDDYSPSLPDTFIQGINLTERTPINTIVLNFENSIFQATDEDCHTDHMIYNIVQTPEMLFSVVENTKLILRGELDYERLSSSSSDEQPNIYVGIIVMSTVSGSTAGYKTSTRNLTINVIDVDDEKPVFDNSIVQLHINETTDLSNLWLRSSPPLVARDGDKGINTTINYKISSVVPSSLNIEINSSTGELKILSQMDYETTREYTVIVTAYQVDNQFMSTNARLQVLVDDVNDNRPEFIPPSTDIHVSENSPNGYHIMTLVAKDTDQGDNAKVRFTIQSDDSNAFGVEYDSTTSTNWLVIRNSTALLGRESAHIKLELREITPVYRVLCDYVTTCVANLTILIDDFNDNSPQFSDGSYSFTVINNGLSNILVGKISASDADKGDNAKISYSSSLITQTLDCKQLMLDPQTGEFILKNPVLGETVCYLLATACDNPADKIVQRCTSVPITVQFKSSGGNSTVIPDYNVTVTENVPRSTPVTVLPLDSVRTNSTDFYIQNNVLYTNTDLDREKQDVYQIMFFNDNKENSFVFKINVLLKDVNDNAPQFSSDIYYINIKEDFLIGQVLLQVNATDSDLRENAELKYSLSTGREYFSIDETNGQIKLISIPSRRDVNGTDYTIIVSDMGTPPLKSTATLKIYVPRFNETAFVILPVEREKLMADHENFEKKLESILGVKIKILNIESLSDISTIGSKVYITASSLQGNQIDATELNSLLRNHAAKIYSTFKEVDEPKSEVYFPPFIAMLVIAILLLLICIVVLILLRRKQKIIKRQKHLFEKLNKSTTIYDSTRANTGSHNGLEAPTTNYDYENVVISNHASHGTFNNPAFVPDNDRPSAGDAHDSSSNSSQSLDHEHERPVGETRVTAPHLSDSNMSAAIEENTSLKNSPASDKRNLHRRHSETDSGVPGIGENFDETDADETDKEVADIYANVNKRDSKAVTSSPNPSSSSNTRRDTSYLDIEEPEPDYGKKVHFGEEPDKFHYTDNQKRDSVVSNNDRVDEEILIPNTDIDDGFYFGESEITAL